MAARPAPSQAAAQPKVTGARLEPRASVIQRLKLSTLGVTHGFAVKQFLTSKAVSHPYYIFIPSVAKPGWHLTIPVTRNLSAAEAADYEFYEYHVSEEGVENIHYQYNYSHKQQHSDALGATKWSTADAVVREIFRVTPVPLHTFMQRVRLTLLKGGQFATLAALDKALKQAATYLEISEQELVAKLNSDEKTRLSYWDDVRKFMPA